MPESKTAAGVGTGRHSKRKNTPLGRFASVGDLRQAVLNAARIEEHAERAGFRRGRGGRWHCGVHADKNPSCTVRDGRIHCWVCNQSWNAIDLEMLGTGEPFMRALRVLAGEYGLRLSSEDYDPATAERKALASRQTEERAFNWRAGFLELADEILAEEKAKLFDPLSGPANESLILSLTRAERSVREAESRRSFVGIFEAFTKTIPDLTDDLARYGERLRYEQQAVLKAFIELMATADADRW